MEPETWGARHRYLAARSGTTDLAPSWRRSHPSARPEAHPGLPRGLPCGPGYHRRVTFASPPGQARRGARARPYDVVCVGNALMDHLAFADFSVLGELGLAPGGMTLVDVETTHRIGRALGGARQVPGGTVTNTAVGIASLGTSSQLFVLVSPGLL